MRGAAHAVVCGLCFLACAGPLAAQGLEEGDYVRLKVPNRVQQRVQGRLVALDEGTFALKVEGQKDPAVFPRSSVTKVEIRRRKGKRMMGGLIGLGVGTAIGTVLFATAEGSFECNTGCAVGLGALLLGVPGIPIGALAAPGARWEEVPHAQQGRVTIWVAPRPDRGVEGRLTVRF